MVPDLLSVTFSHLLSPSLTVSHLLSPSLTFSHLRQVPDLLTEITALEQLFADQPEKLAAAHVLRRAFSDLASR